MMSGIDGLLHIAEALQVNLSLTKIHLSFVNLLLTKQNGLALTKMNKSLTLLDLSDGFKCIIRTNKTTYERMIQDIN